MRRQGGDGVNGLRGRKGKEGSREQTGGNSLDLKREGAGENEEGRIGGDGGGGGREGEEGGWDWTKGKESDERMQRVRNRGGAGDAIIIDALWW
jgi:hypothetical protein